MGSSAYAEPPKKPAAVQKKVVKKPTATKPPIAAKPAAKKPSTAAAKPKTSQPAKKNPAQAKTSQAKPATSQPSGIQKKPLATPSSAKPMQKSVQQPSPTPSLVPKIIQAVPRPGAPPLSQTLIIIDPGHGGYDLGARMSACDEKSLALSTALLTKKHLTDMGYRVILTRSRDVFLPLEKRTSIANETKSKLFVSIHYNAARNSVAKGIEVFYYVSADKIRTGASKKLATRVLSKLIDKTVAESRGIKEGNFYVIRETKMPAILVEAGFMTHPEELHRLKDVSYRDKIARGIAEGIDSFFKA